MAVIIASLRFYREAQVRMDVHNIIFQQLIDHIYSLIDLMTYESYDLMTNDL